MLCALCCSAGEVNPKSNQVIVSGHVLDSDNIPVPNAKVSIRLNQKAPLITPKSPSADKITVISDEHGDFSGTVKASSPVMLFVSGEADGYISCGNPTMPTRETVTIVPAGSDKANVKVCLTRPSQIDGKLVDSDSGQPVSEAHVAAMRQGFYKGGMVLSGRAQSTSTKDGIFSLTALPPGNYVLLINSEPFVQFRPPLTSQVPNQKEVNSQGYGRVYWPSMTADYPPESETIPIPAGASVPLGAIRLHPQRLYTLKVTTHDFACSTGHSVRASLLVQHDSGLEELAQGEAPCAAFAVDNLPRGTYILTVAQSWDPHELASQIVEVAKDNRLDIIGETTTTVNGTLQVEGASNSNSFPSILSGITVFLRPRNSNITLDQKPAQVSAEGTFTSIVFPDQPYEITYIGLPNTYYVKSVRVNGIPQPDLKRFTPSRPASLQVMLSDKPATFQGRSVDSSDKKLREPCVFILVKSEWIGSRRVSERVQIPAGEDGTGVQSGLAPGTYQVICDRGLG